MIPVQLYKDDDDPMPTVLVNGVNRLWNMKKCCFESWRVDIVLRSVFGFFQVKSEDRSIITPAKLPQEVSHFEGSKCLSTLAPAFLSIG